MTENAIPRPDEGILLAIELIVISYYRTNPELVDYNADKVYEAMQRHYEKEIQGKNPPKLRLKDFELDLYEKLSPIIASFMEEDSKTDEETGETIVYEAASKEQVVDCLKQLRKSIKTWTGNAYGRRGYLDYVARFLGGFTE